PPQPHRRARRRRRVRDGGVLCPRERCARACAALRPRERGRPVQALWRALVSDEATAIQIEPEEEDAVKVTLRDVYAIMLEVRDQVRDMHPLPSRIEDHETRIRSLERKVWAAAGAAAAAGGV